MIRHIDNFISRRVRKIINFWNSLIYNKSSREGREMASIFDVADFILEEKGTVTAWQLQKLCYYSKAWGLAINRKPIFPESFEAWVNGPVCPELYRHHQGWKIITRKRFAKGDSDCLTKEVKALIKAVLKEYDGLSGEDLKDMTHSEGPWVEARGNISLDAPCHSALDEDRIASYYSGIQDTLDNINDTALSFLESHSDSKDFFREPANLPKDENRKYFRIYGGKKTISVDKRLLKEYEENWYPVHSYILEAAIGSEDGDASLPEDKLSELAEKGLKYELYFATHTAEDAWKAVRKGIIA